jgi:hypothetical protein
MPLERTIKQISTNLLPGKDILLDLILPKIDNQLDEWITKIRLKINEYDNAINSEDIFKDILGVRKPSALGSSSSSKLSSVSSSGSGSGSSSNSNSNSNSSSSNKASGGLGLGLSSSSSNKASGGLGLGLSSSSSNKDILGVMKPSSHVSTANSSSGFWFWFWF